MESRFALLASVGLMVLAPSPLRMTDCRLLFPDDGVCVRLGPFLPGDRAFASGDAAPFARACERSRGGGCSDFALMLRVALLSRGVSLLELPFDVGVGRALWTLLFTDDERAKLAAVAAVAVDPWESMPGPTDFLGVRTGAVLVGVEDVELMEFCRRARVVAGAGGGGGGIDGTFVDLVFARPAVLSRRTSAWPREVLVSAGRC